MGQDVCGNFCIKVQNSDCCGCQRAEAFFTIHSWQAEILQQPYRRLHALLV